MAMTRVAAPVAAFTPAVRAPRRAQRVQMRVAAMEPPAAAEAEAAEPEVSSEELYRRFEEMIAQHDMAYSVGDRVRRAAAMCGAGGGTCLRHCRAANACPAAPACSFSRPLALPAARELHALSSSECTSTSPNWFCSRHGLLSPRSVARVPRRRCCTFTLAPAPLLAGGGHRGACRPAWRVRGHRRQVHRLLPHC